MFMCISYMLECGVISTLNIEQFNYVSLESLGLDASFILMKELFIKCLYRQNQLLVRFNIIISLVKILECSQWNSV